MDTKIFERFRDSLLAQRRNLKEWLRLTTPQERQLRLGPLPEMAVQEHLQVLDTAVAKAEDQSLGLCTVCNDYVEMSRLEVDYTASICIDHYTADQRRKLESELELSQKVQKALLPQNIPDLDGLELAAFSQPARIVGGDYFDFFKFKNGSPGFVIADVMGKGVAASLLMASLQASLRILVTEEESPAEVALRLNQLFYHNINLSKFVTLVLARYEPDSRSLIYCNAGHNPPLLFHNSANGQQAVKWLQPTGAAVGLVENFQFENDSIKLQNKDVIILYTDGVTEARNAQDEEFGPDRIAATVQQNSALSSRELIAALRRHLQEFTNGQPLEDDTTIVAAKVG
jgi:sigma-B regulation protein RsbU (phosphoserine phosphatase)